MARLRGKARRRAIKRLARKRGCKVYRVAGTLRRSGKAGANKVPFSGRIGKKALKPATYRASIVATDAAGNASKTQRKNFRVVKAAKRVKHKRRSRNPVT